MKQSHSLNEKPWPRFYWRGGCVCGWPLVPSVCVFAGKHTSGGQASGFSSGQLWKTTQRVKTPRELLEPGILVR